MKSTIDWWDVVIAMTGFVASIMVFTWLSRWFDAEMMAEAFAIPALLLFPWLRRKIFGKPPEVELKTGPFWRGMTIVSMLLVFASVGLLFVFGGHLARSFAPEPDMEARARAFLREYPPVSLRLASDPVAEERRLLRDRIVHEEKDWQERRAHLRAHGTKGALVGFGLLSIACVGLRLRQRAPADASEVQAGV